MNGLAAGERVAPLAELQDKFNADPYTFDTRLATENLRVRCDMWKHWRLLWVLSSTPSCTCVDSIVPPDKTQVNIAKMREAAAFLEVEAA